MDIKLKHDFPKTSAPAERALLHAGIKKLAQLAKHREADIAALHGMGPKAIGILRLALKQKGLDFKE
jgi:predicted Fe-Mo cluster-binding NifX family protein